jgi:small-conductance mechanosensitive channel
MNKFLSKLRPLADEPSLWIGPLVVFAFTLAVAWVVRRVLLRTLSAWAARLHSRPALILTEALGGPTYIWGLILAAHLAVQSSDLPAGVTGRYGPEILGALWIISLTIMLMRIAGNLVRFYGSEIPGALPVTTLTENLAQIGVLVLGLMLLLRDLGVEITPILTALGVGGLAVALALQDTLSNLFGGFYVAVARQVRLTDYIRLNTGEEGYVADIGWRSTSIQSMAGNLIIVPNLKLSQAIVTNYTLPSAWLGSGLQVVAAGTADPERAECVLLGTLTAARGQIPGMLDDPPPSVLFDPGLVDAGWAFTVSYRVTEFAVQAHVRAELQRRLYRALSEAGIAPGRAPVTVRPVTPSRTE